MIRLFSGLVLLLGILYLTSCDNNPTQSVAPVPGPSFKGAFIVNEGNFTQGNASLSFFNAGAGLVVNNVFQQANNAALGDVANSMVVEDTLGYIVVNNSDKIEVISVNTYRRVRTITLPAGSSPRNMVLLGDGRAYVTELFNNAVLIINVNTGAVAGSIPVGPNPEGLLLINDKVLVANSGFGSGHTVSVISTTANAVVDSIGVGDGPQWIEIDPQGGINVLCGGSFGADFSTPDDDTPGGVWVLNAGNFAVTDSLVLPKGDHPSELTISQGGSGYFLDNGTLTQYNTSTYKIVNSSVVKGTYYHVRVNDDTATLYLLDAKDFVAPGELQIRDFNGNLLGSYTVGIIPGFVAFVNTGR